MLNLIRTTALRQFTRALPGATVEDGFGVQDRLRVLGLGLSKVQVIRVLAVGLRVQGLRVLAVGLREQVLRTLAVGLGVQVVRILAGLRVEGLAVGLRVQDAGRVQATYTIFYLSRYIRLFHGCTESSFLLASS